MVDNSLLISSQLFMHGLWQYIHLDTILHQLLILQCYDTDGWVI